MLVLLATAFAGGLTLDDPSARLSAGDRSALERAVAAVPFDVHAGVDDRTPELDALTARAAALRDQEGGLVVLVDPTHRHTAVQIDAGVGVKKAYFDDIRASGDESFRAGSWGGGLVSIVERTEARRRGVVLSGGSSGRRSTPARQSTLASPEVVAVAITLGLAALVLIAWMLGWRPSSGNRRREGSSSGFTFGSPTDWSSSSSDFGSSSSSSSDSGSSGGDSGGSSGSW